MAIVFTIAILVGWVVWANWGRDKTQGALANRLDPVWSRLTRSKKCQWVATGISGESLRSFRCKSCGVTAYSAQAGGPQECKRGLNSGKL